MVVIREVEGPEAGAGSRQSRRLVPVRDGPLVGDPLFPEVGQALVRPPTLAG